MHAVVASDDYMQSAYRMGSQILVACRACCARRVSRSASLRFDSIAFNLIRLDPIGSEFVRLDLIRFDPILSNSN